ncbi:MAG: Ig-like domain repeat protein [Solirubrobacterales bacterium]|nr:Ig-like domain repeat protein [Solirubrobacterales bacterium]
MRSIRERQRFARGKGPRELRGTVDDDPSGLAAIRLRLTRTTGKVCTTYDGEAEAFKAMKKCGAARGRWFTIGTTADWTYLLPSKLGRGRYVLDLQVVDKAGNTTRLARGATRVVFTVA